MASLKVNTRLFFRFSPLQYNTCFVNQPPILAKYFPQLRQTDLPSSSDSGNVLRSTLLWLVLASVYRGVAIGGILDVEATGVVGVE